MKKILVIIWLFSKYCTSDEGINSETVLLTKVGHARCHKYLFVNLGEFPKKLVKCNQSNVMNLSTVLIISLSLSNYYAVSNCPVSSPPICSVIETQVIFRSTSSTYPGMSAIHSDFHSVSVSETSKSVETTLWWPT